MPTNMTFTPSRATVVAPVGADAATLSGIVAMVQGVGDHSAWNKESMIVATQKAPVMSGIALASSTSFTTITDGSIATDFSLVLRPNDIVLLYASGAVEFNAVTGYFNLHWHDGTSELARHSFVKAAAWNANEIANISLGALYVASTSVALTFALRASRQGGLTPTGSGEFRAFCVHIKKGTA